MKHFYFKIHISAVCFSPLFNAFLCLTLAYLSVLQAADVCSSPSASLCKIAKKHKLLQFILSLRLTVSVINHKLDGVSYKVIRM